jgi:hypothetical protein
MSDLTSLMGQCSICGQKKTVETKDNKVADNFFRMGALLICQDCKNKSLNSGAELPKATIELPQKGKVKK